MKYRIIGQISEPIYQEILNIAFDESNFFSVCTFKFRHKKDLSDNYFDFLDAINLYKEDEFEFCLPKHYTKGQKFNVYELNKITKTMIRKVKTINSWMTPNYPEDLAFYNNKKVWLSSISHENIIFVETENCELMKRFVNLDLQLIKQL